MAHDQNKAIEPHSKTLFRNVKRTTSEVMVACETTTHEFFVYVQVRLVDTASAFNENTLSAKTEMDSLNLNELSQVETRFLRQDYR